MIHTCRALPGASETGCTAVERNGARGARAPATHAEAGPLRRAAAAALATVLSAAAVLAPLAPAGSAATAAGAPPLYDGANVVASELRSGLTEDLEALER